MRRSSANRLKRQWRRLAWCCSAVALATFASSTYAQSWRGLQVAPEHRCSQYDRKSDYSYSQSLEQKIIDSMGQIYSPYTGECFSSKRETDIEHIVAAAEAHDSGLCRADRATRKKFANDLRNLTLASPSVNRNQKKDKDAAQWQPSLNKCWFAATVVKVRRAYGLTIDVREAAALEHILAKCDSTQMQIYRCGNAPSSPSSAGAKGDALAKYDDDGSGTITCAEARRHNIAPVRRSHPAYVHMRDGDGDGVVCE